MDDGLNLMAQSQTRDRLIRELEEARAELERAAKCFAETDEQLIAGGMVADTMDALECSDVDALGRIREMLRDELGDAARWYADALAELKSATEVE